MSDDHSEMEPPESISNSEVKRLCADGSVGFPHVRVGRCQAPLIELPRAPTSVRGIFLRAWLIFSVKKLCPCVGESYRVCATRKRV